MTTIATVTEHDFKVADLSLAAFGRKEIQLAEHEMPGLMTTRREYGERQPLREWHGIGLFLTDFCQFDLQTIWTNDHINFAGPAH